MGESRAFPEHEFENTTLDQQNQKRKGCRFSEQRECLKAKKLTKNSEKTIVMLPECAFEAFLSEHGGP